VLFYFLARVRVPLGIPFYLWVGIFNFMVVAQFWSFANDVYDPDQGKRLFAIVGFGMSAGAVSGSFIAGRLIDVVGLQQLMLLSAALLVASLLLTSLVERRHAPREVVQADKAPADMAGPNGFTLLLRSRYLLLIAAMMILANLVNTTGEYILGAKVKETREAAVAEVVRTPGQSDAAWTEAQDARRDEVGAGIGRFYADFFSVVNAVGLLIQLFLVSRIVRWFGVRWGILILPLVAMGGYATIALLPAMGVVRWAKTAENATDYSLQNTVRNMLFLPTTRQEKYKAKQAIDTFCVRIGDVAAALLVFVGTTWVQLSPAGFAGVNVVLAGLWIVVAVAIGRRFHDLSRS
jgi:AAA family ATP:ADP antiporter